MVFVNCYKSGASAGIAPPTPPEAASEPARANPDDPRNPSPDTASLLERYVGPMLA